jgi:hypothetical protein
MKSALAAVIAALLTIVFALHVAPSSAQGKLQTPKTDDSESKAKERKASDRDYKSAIDRLPDQKFDPWRNLR